MVNKTVLEYLRKYKDKYPMVALKKKIVSAGYPLKDVDEAIAFLGGKSAGKGVAKSVEKPVVAKHVSVKHVKPRVVGKRVHKTVHKQVHRKPQVHRTPERRQKMVNQVLGGKKTRWMKIAGVIGLIIAAFVLINFVLSFFDSDLSVLLSKVHWIVGLIIGVVFLILAFFYYFGFDRLGKATQSKLLRVSAWVVFVSLVLVLVLTVVNSLVSVGITQNIIQGGLSGGVGASQANEFLLKALTVAVFVSGFCLFLFLVLLSGSLITLRKKVKFGLAAGILGVIVRVIVLILYTGFVVLAVFSPKVLFEIIFKIAPYLVEMSVFGSGLGQPTMLFYGIVIGSYVVGIVIGVLEALVLFSGSRNFERR